MAEIENLVLEHLRRMNIRLDDLGRNIGEIKHRVGNLETAFAGFSGRMSGVEAVLATQSLRLDRVDDRLTRIERRLDLVEPH
jgi:uncharacterized coiled-coil protein SlyX